MVVGPAARLTSPGVQHMSPTKIFSSLRIYYQKRFKAAQMLSIISMFHLFRLHLDSENEIENIGILQKSDFPLTLRNIFRKFQIKVTGLNRSRCLYGNKGKLLRNVKFYATFKQGQY
jgi:hypothetical protein